MREQDQINLTDEDSRIMKVAGGGFDQCYNAQAVVATGSMLIVATEVTQAANDKEQLVPMIEKIQALPKELGRAKRILADSGYFSEANVEKAEAAKIEPLIALGRSRHHVSWKQRFAAAPKAPPDSATAMQKDGASTEDPARTQALCVAQTNTRTSVRHHQIGDGISAKPVARTRKRQRRMESGDDELEHQTNVRDAVLLREAGIHVADIFQSTSL